jgi:hypothetical protein
MPYVAKAIAQDERAKWLTAPRLGGCRTFAQREFAEVFDTESEAKDAILVMLAAECCRGIAFSVESADRSPLDFGDDTRRWA